MNDFLQNLPTANTETQNAIAAMRQAATADTEANTAARELLTAAANMRTASNNAQNAVQRKDRNAYVAAVEAQRTATQEATSAFQTLKLRTAYVKSQAQ
jgi:hypothetical protein